MPAEIQRGDLITDDAFKMPGELAKELDKVTISLQKVLDAAKKAEGGIINAKTTADTTKATRDLGTAQTELEKIQVTYAKSTQKLSDEYLSYKKAISAVNDEAKTRIQLGDKEAKTINAQTASYNQLKAALDKNRSTYKELATESARNSTTGKELLSVINSQATQFNKLQIAMGLAKDENKEFKEKFDASLATLGKIGPAATEAVETGLNKFSTLSKLVSGPVIAGFAALFGAIQVGKKIFEEYTETTAEGIGALKQFKVEYEAMSEVIRDKTLEHGKTTVTVVGFIKSAFIAGIESILGITDEAEQKEQEIRGRLAVNRDIRNQEIELIVKGERLQLESAKAMFEARDKISNVDKERLIALNTAEKLILEKESLERKLIEDKILSQRKFLIIQGVELTNDMHAIDLLHNKQALSRTDKDQIEKLAQLEAEVDKIEEGFFQSARRRQALRFNITEDIIKRAINSFNTEQEANDKTNIAILQSDQVAQQKIIGNQQHSLDEQLAALDQFQIDRAKLIDVQAEKDKRAAFESAFNRVEVKPGENATPQQVIDARTKAAAADKDYLMQIKSIEDAASLERQKSYTEEGNKTAKIITDNYQHYIDIRKKFNQEDTNQDLIALNMQLQNKEITLRQYNIQRNKLNRTAQKEDFTIQIQEQQQALSDLQAYLNNKENITQADAELLKKIQQELSKSIKDQSDADTAAVERALQKRHDLILSFQQQLFSSISTTASNIFASNQQDLDMQSKALEDSHNKELALLGEKSDVYSAANEEELRQKAQANARKNQLDTDYETKKATLDKKSLENKQRQARFDRNLAAVQVIVKTAEAIADTLPLLSNPFTFGIGVANMALISAIGIAQEVAILSKPIPAYEKGTKSASGGYSLIGEAGAEAYKEPGKPWKLSPNSATILNIAKGTEVIPHDQTMNAIAMQGISREAGIDNQNKQFHYDLKQIMKESTDRTVKAIKENGGDLYAQGGLIYKTIQLENGSRKHVRLKNLSA